MQPSAKVWQVRQGRWHFAESGEFESAGKTFSSLIYYNAPPLQDFEMQVEVMFLSQSSSAGLFFRAEGKRFYQDTTFYQFEWYTKGRHHSTRLSLMVKNPKWKQIVTPILREAPLNRWITFRVRAQGESIQTFIDGNEVFSKRDRTFLRKGRLGIHVFMPAAVKFRGFQLKKLE